MTVILACLIYAAAMVTANLTIAAFGPWISPINAFFLIGLDLTLRDKLHDLWQDNVWPKMTALILVSAGISYWINPASGQIALASFVAFAVAGFADAVVYRFLIKRGYMTRVNGSNAVGAGVDSLLFPTIAFGTFMPHIVLLQFAAKFGGGFIWSLLLRKRLTA